MKLTTGILAAVVMTGGAWAQNPNIINNVQNKMTAVQQQKAADSNAALGMQSTTSNGQAKKPSPAGSAAGVKPTAAAKPVSLVAKPASIPEPKKTSLTNSNRLERVKVIRHADDIQIEMATREPVTPTVDKLSSPARVVVELPATSMATEQSKIAVGAAGIKGVRIGVNGKTPPTTSVVVDLEHAVNYEISPGPSNTFVLTLHAQGANLALARSPAATTVAKSQPSQKPAVKPVTVAARKTAPGAASKSAAAVGEKTVAATLAASMPKPPTAKPVTAIKTQMPAQAPKIAVVPASPKLAVAAKRAPPAPVAASKTVAAKRATIAVAPKVAVAVKPEIAKGSTAAPKAAKVTIAAKEEPKPTNAQAPKNAADDKLPPIGTTADDSKAPKPEEKKWAMNGKRDPFFSPVVQQASGSGCSTGKKCLEIGQINVRGIVKSEAGFIAVVTNSMNKAYFLHENDPVFNGYVLRITGDSVVFQETYQDKFGKPLTREVTKTVVAPAV